MVGNDGTGHVAVVLRPNRGSTACAVVPLKEGGSTAQDGERRSPTAVDRSGTTGDAKFKKSLSNFNPKGLEAISILLKPRLSQKMRRTMPIAPKN